jgi:adenosylcobinamide-phosphate synthase
MNNFSMQDLPQINDFTNAVLLLLSVLLVKFAISYFINHDPLKYFRFYCTKLSDKVNKQTNSQTQQSIAGLVAIIITLTPLVIILWLFEAFIEVVWLWQGFLLYLAIGSFGLHKANKTLAQALVANNKYLAKQTLKPLVLRNTEQLSSMGLSKAAIEMQILKVLQLQFIIICYFILLGPLAALTVRLLFEMHYSWNIKRRKFVFFGLYINKIINLIQWLPSRFFTLLILFSMMINISSRSKKINMVLCWRLLQGKFFQLNNDIVIHCIALSLEVKLGGVAIYDDNKLRKNSFNDSAKQPEPADVIHAGTLIKQVLTVALALLILAATLITLLQNGAS